MSSTTTWEHQVRQQPRQRVVVVPDAHYGLNSIAAMAQTIAARVPDRFDLVAWSMGGYIALELYPLVRERIRSLTLISTSARAESRDALIRRAEFLRAAQTYGLHAAFVASLDQMIKEPQRIDADFRARIISDSVSLGEEVLFSQNQGNDRPQRQPLAPEADRL
jgi:pimeloyl-ACP methyl ester carboxylesterase